MPLTEHRNPTLEVLHVACKERGFKLELGLDPCRSVDDLLDHRSQCGHWPEPARLAVMVVSDSIVLLREVVAEHLETTATLVLGQLAAMPR